MNDATRILFKEKFGDEQATLFNNKLDLATKLLTDKDSDYSLKDEDLADFHIFNKNLNRLQSYISQLFSGTGTRKITPVFRSSLGNLLTKRLRDISNDDPKVLLHDIIKSLTESNIKSEENLRTPRSNQLNDFLNDFKESNYAVVFTSRPLELEANPSEAILRIRDAVVNEICNYFFESYSIKQKFRFNFPDHQLGILFWRRIAYLITKRIAIIEDGKNKLSEYMNLIYNKNIDWKESFNSRLKKYNIVLEEPKTDEQNVRLLVHHFLAYINEIACFQVFESKEAVFVIPHIIFNPNESNNIKGYIFLDEKNNSVELHKYGNRDLTVWQDKVWNTIKANKNTREILYVESIEDTVVLNFV